jgi:hypothetical protein
MNILQIIINFFSLTEPRYLALLGIKIVCIAVGFLLIRKFQPRWKYPGYLVLSILLVRVFLFDHYLSWEIYNKYLSVDDIGWRQQSAIHVEKGKFFKSDRNIQFLAVGSSQTYVIYSPYSKKHNDLVVFNFAGMTMLDLYLYRHYIAAKQPEYVLLYLSEFDMAKEPSLDAAKLAPSQGLDFFGNYPMLSAIAREARSELSLKEMVVGEFFPEYKYAFMFKGLTEKLTGKNKALRTKSLYEQLSPDADQLTKDLTGLTDSLDERWISYNAHFLAEFLGYCKEHALNVVIVEGQYNPRAYTAKTAVLNRKVRVELERMAKEFDVVFIERSQTRPFSAEDYMDAEHVKPDPAYDFVERLMSGLKKQ